LPLEARRAPLAADYVERLDAATVAGRRGDAVEIFMRDAIGLPDEYLTGMRADPSWAGLEAIAHTIAYDGRIVRDLMTGQPLPPGRWAAVTMPTLAIAGAETEPFFHSGARALVANLPNAEYRILAGQGHAVDPVALAPLLIDFFAGR
jgi:pimeloyl-ACP methyl ester carboxylesterase